ncbi:MAG: bifunctional aldolase/short-chain dehydrogenase [Firmicutes bacterium]|nr:bifunctional aldolase/short-chain dehydrogenase [Bacillota bacterium]
MRSEQLQPTRSFRVPDLWDENEARRQVDELDMLVYRSRLLGADRRVCNWKGGNTSTKCTQPGPTGRPQRVLWVKGSGSDLAAASRKDFVGLRLDDVLPLMERDAVSDEEMVEYLSRCVLHPGMPRQSIETLLHAFIPYDYVDHTHPDSIIAFCTTDDGKRLMEEVFGNRAAWIPYIRPGFDLAKQVGLAVRNNPGLQAVFLGKHGLVTWGNTAEECYRSTIEIINEAGAFIEKRAQGRAAFGGLRFPGLSSDARRRLARQVLPLVRGLVSREKRMILHYDDSEEILTFVNGRDARELALTGAACPDHLVHTKYVPLFVDFDPAQESVEVLEARLRQGVDRYAAEYREYVRQNRRESGEATDDPYPRVILIPGLGMIATGKDKATARNTAGLFHRAVAVMDGASVLGRYVSMTPQEACDVEYWPLERYKLTLAPPERELSRRVALITGAGSGIGRATAELLAQAGAHVVVADINVEAARQVAAAINSTVDQERALAVQMDVTDETMVAAGYDEAVLAYGGVDILVSNAGTAMAGRLEDTTLSDWERLFRLLSTGYFLASREAVRCMKRQGIGGSIVFVTSKNAVVASKHAAAYNAAKAAELHLARSLAEELGPDGIRVNCVAPDAVLAGSGIWSGRWREERAAAYGIAPEELDEYYRRRTALRVNVYPDDVAQAILFFASDRSAKTTGCTLTVDGGVQAAYMR